MTKPYRSRPARGIVSVSLAVAALATVRPAVAQVSVEVVHTFTGLEAPHAPNNLIQAADGNFYGTNRYGGQAAIARLTPAGRISIVHALTAAEGTGVTALLQASDGNLYGATNNGGASGRGTIFRLTLDGTFAIVHSFSGRAFFGAPGDDDGASPTALVQASDGNFYGVTSGGGSGSTPAGTFFRMTPAGTVTVLHSFSDFAESSPSKLMQASDGSFYSGNERQLFKLTAAGTLVFTTTASANTLSAYQPSTLVEGADGNLYGTTVGQCFVAKLCGKGIAFKLSPGGTVTALHEFAGVLPGTPSNAALVQAGGVFYGTTFGAVFKMTASGDVTVVHTFTGDPDDGSQPSGLVRSTDGNLYGTTDSARTLSLGTMFRIAADDTFTRIATSFVDGPVGGAVPTAALLRGTDGNFYGTTSAGGTFGVGTIFRLTAAGSLSILHNFAGGADGAGPYASLIQATDGNFYGTTYYGGSANLGTIFQMTLAGAVTVVHAFAGGTAGAHPYAPLIQAVDGRLYGITQGSCVPFSTCESAPGGTIFRMPLGGPVTIVRVLDYNLEGVQPYAALVQGTDGNFYGSTTRGRNLGSLFRMTPDGAITVLLSGSSTFASGGSSPYGALVQGSDGNFYGAMTVGGAKGGGTIFRLTPGGSFTVLHDLDDSTEGQAAEAPLLQAADGNLYGVARLGGTRLFGPGMIFQLTPAGTFSVLYAFTGGSDGANPVGGLIQAADGKLYGTATAGGLGSGVIVRLSVAPQVPTIVTQPANQTVNAGRPVVFTVVGNGLPAPGYQWQVSADSGVSWTNVTDGIRYNGAITKSLTVRGVLPINGYQFRAVATNSVGTAISNAAVLTVRPRVDLDVNGDGKADLVVFRPSSGTWFSESTSTVFLGSQQWGLSGDVPVPGDYSGSGKMERAVYRPTTSLWYIPSLSAFAFGFSFGLPGDIPVPGDYDGDGRTDLAVYRPSNGVWYIRGSSTNEPITVALGLSTDIPVPNDYDGDGETDAAVYRPSTGMWYIRQSSTGARLAFQWGLRGDVPVPGDYDGDSLTDLAVYRPSTGVWYIRQSSTGFTTSVAFKWGESADIAAPADVDGDGTIDLTVFRPATGEWLILTSTTGYTTSMTLQWGLPGDIPVPNAAVAYAMAASSGKATVSPLASLTRASDLNGDGIADLTVYRPSTGTWYTAPSNSDPYSNSFASHRPFLVPPMFLGFSGDIPVTGDFDGDGKTDIAVFTPPTGLWTINLTSVVFPANLQVTYQWGLFGDLPVPGDYDGDDRTDVAVYRPSTGVWYIRYSGGGFTTFASYQWGLPNDITVPGDYDGDGVTDLAVYRPATGEWFIRYSTTGYATFATFQWGLGGDITVPGDYDGDGKTDLAVYRPSTNVWYMRQSSTGYSTFVTSQWGLSGDVPVPGDYDGDGKTDVAVHRPSTGVWYLLRSSTGFTTSNVVQWGLPGDIQILARQ